jgi:hypothetical protein
MTLVSAMQYCKTLLDGLEWPAAMMALPSPPGPLEAYVTSPIVTTTASSPQAYVWFTRLTENRDNAKYGAGTVPRAQFQGAPSGTKAVEHQVAVYVTWPIFSGDPNMSTVFPGMLDAIRAQLRYSADPELITDPWTGEQSWLVDVGETITVEQDLWALAPERLERWDALLTVPVTEVIFA